MGCYEENESEQRERERSRQRQTGAGLVLARLGLARADWIDWGGGVEVKGTNGMERGRDGMRWVEGWQMDGGDGLRPAWVWCWFFTGVRRQAERKLKGETGEPRTNTNSGESGGTCSGTLP